MIKAMSQTHSQTWDHVCSVLLQSAVGSPIREALRLAGILSIPNLIMQAKESNLDDLEYPDPNDTTLVLPLPVGQRRKVRAIQEYNLYLCLVNSSPIVTWSTLTLDDFDNFRITVYKPDQPITKFQHISIHGGNQATVLHGTAGPNVNSQVTPKFTSFMRGVKRDKPHYKAFKLERYWDDWNRGFRATAKTHI
jgi:hypothetical protein